MDHCQQRHLRHGIEEMQADELSRVFELAVERLERQARGVGGEQRFGPHAWFGSGVQRTLGLEILDNCFDDEIGPGDAAAGHISTLSRSAACMRSAGVGRRFSNNARARVSAGSMYLSSRSCSVTVSPRSAHQAAISPPITPAPMMCACSKRRASLAGQTLEAILQQEHADQVACGRCSADERGEEILPPP